MKKLLYSFIMLMCFGCRVLAASSNAVPTNAAIMVNYTNLNFTFPTNASCITNFFITNDIARLSAMNAISNSISSNIFIVSNLLAGYSTTNNITNVQNRVYALEAQTNNWNITVTNAATFTNWWTGSNAVNTFSDVPTWNAYYSSIAEITNWYYTSNIFSIVGYTSTWNQAAVDAVTATNQIAALSNSLSGAYGMYRYEACADTDYEIYVRATGTGIVATVTGTDVALTIPDNVILCSMRLRWPGSSASTTYTVDLGSNDMSNVSFTNRWGAAFWACREDTGAFLPTASCRLDASTHSKLIVSGMIVTPSTVINHCMFEF